MGDGLYEMVLVMKQSNLPRCAEELRRLDARAAHFIVLTTSNKTRLSPVLQIRKEVHVLHVHSVMIVYYKR